MSTTEKRKGTGLAFVRVLPSLPEPWAADLRCEAGLTPCCHGSKRHSFLHSCVPSPALLATVTVLFLCSETALILLKALKDGIVRPHCDQITWEGKFSFPDLKLDTSVCISETEIAMLAERGLLGGDPRTLSVTQVCPGTTQKWARTPDSAGCLYWCWNPAPKRWAGMWKGLYDTEHTECLPSRHWCQSIWSKGTDFPIGLGTNALNWLWTYHKLFASVLEPIVMKNSVNTE